MIRLVYASRMTDVCEMESLQAILQTSRKNNLEAGITGILMYDPKFFLQCLEGPKEVVNKLYAKILADIRHKDETLLEYANIQDRTFGNWTMGLLRTENLDPDTLKSYTGSNQFDPYKLSGERVMHFLITVVAQEKKRLDEQSTQLP